MEEHEYFDRAPLGEMAASRLVGYVRDLGDFAERHYLEIKGPLDISSKPAKAKIAKFILGAANRSVDRAQRTLEGHAAIIIGISMDDPEGIPRVEVLELSKGIEPYLGAEGPAWDAVWIPARTAGQHILVVVVDPPKFGQHAFPCRASGDGLIDGRIYIRAEGATREANSSEIDMLQKRASKASPQASFAVAVEDSYSPLKVNESLTLEQHISQVGQALRAKWSDAQAAIESNGFATLMAERTSPIFGANVPEDRTPDKYFAQIEAWAGATTNKWATSFARSAGFLLTPPRFTVHNRALRYFRDVRIEIHLSGPVMGVEFREDSRGVPSPDDLELPSPPRPWGPRLNPALSNALNLSGLHASMINPYIPDLGPSRVSWKNSGSMDIILEVGDIRPEEVRTVDDEEFVLFLRDDDSLEAIDGTWRITAADVDEVFSGNFSIERGASTDATAFWRQVFELDH